MNMQVRDVNQPLELSSDNGKIIKKYINGDLSTEKPGEEFKLVITPNEAHRVANVHPLALVAGMMYLSRQQFIYMIESWKKDEFIQSIEPNRALNFIQNVKNEVKMTVTYDPPSIEKNGYKRVLIDPKKSEDNQYAKYWSIARYIVITLTNTDMLYFAKALVHVGNKYQV